MKKEIQNKDPRIRGVIKDSFPILYDGLMTQLVSTPADFWINQCLYDSYPSLRRKIEEGLSKIISISHESLSYQVTMLITEIVSRASNSMNAALVSFAAELLRREGLAEPYRNTIFEEIGKKLRPYNSIDRGHLGDKETTDNCARELNLEGWYGWRRF